MVVVVVLSFSTGHHDCNQHGDVQLGKVKQLKVDAVTTLLQKALLSSHTHEDDDE